MRQPRKWFAPAVEIGWRDVLPATFTAERTGEDRDPAGHWLTAAEAHP
jgi:hypothetical protein